MPRLVLYTVFPFSDPILNRERIEDGRTDGRKVVHLSCYWDGVLTRGSHDVVHVRDTRGRFDGEPTVRRPGSSTRASTTSPHVRGKQGLFRNFLTTHSM